MPSTFREVCIKFAWIFFCLIHYGAHRFLACHSIHGYALRNCNKCYIHLKSSNYLIHLLMTIFKETLLYVINQVTSPSSL